MKDILPTKMLRRYRSFKKLVYAAAILFTTITIYATTSLRNSDEEDTEWILPINDDGRQRGVDEALLRPLNRLPLGPFEEHELPVVVETLNMNIPEFNESKSGLSPTNVNPPAAGAVAAPAPAPAKPLAPAPAPAQAPAAAAPKPPVPAAAQAPAPAAAAPKPPAPAAAPAPAAPAAAPAPAAKPAAPPAAPAAAPAPAPAAAAPAPAAPAAAPAPAAKPAAPPAAPKAPTAKPPPDYDKVDAEIKQRIAQTKEQCNKFQVPNTVDSDVYLLQNNNITYCKVPKSGSTYWEQVFAYLFHNSNELKYLGFTSPFQISKFDIRYTSYFNLPRRHWKLEEDKADINKALKILFVRHPLERLWSSYIEKFYLLDYWTTLALQMKTTGVEEKCPKSVTFREFIDFTLPLFNENWAPVTELCNPCTYEPDIIGHVETMRDDTFYTLKRAKLHWIFTEQDRLSREESQMTDVLVYNYQIHSINWYSFYHRCFSKKDLATRLWEVFRKVGYFSSHAVLPPDLSDYNQTTIMKEMKTQFKKFSLGNVNGRLQQLKVMRRDFESLPKPTMAKVLEKYAMDFQLFGYSTTLPTT